MRNSERETLISIIRRMLDEVRTDIQQLEELTRPISPDNAIGRISRMDAINNKSINDSALREKVSIKNRLEKALERSSSNDFGNCVRCGKPIPFGRLEFMPYTTRCTPCAAI